MCVPASRPLTYTHARWSAAPKCSSVRMPACFLSGSGRRYQSTCPGRSVFPTPDSGASGEKGTRICPSHAPGQASEAVTA